jgi:hypothetical protein
MRRVVGILLVMLFLATTITGFVEPQLDPGDAETHTIISILFIFVMLTHVVINRKPFVRYFRGSNG